MDSTENNLDDRVPNETRRNLVVGIGASAGGLLSLEEFFSVLPSDTGCSFVVVQHLSPDFDSAMDVLLARQTQMPIRVIESGMRLEPDTIFLSPARMNVELSAGEFTISPLDPDSLRLPINAMFHSVGREYGTNAVAIVMSGTGSDGTHGIKNVHESLGLTMVQSVETAEFDGMPKNAIATGCVDFVLSPASMAQTICEHAVTPVETANGSSADNQAENLDGLNEIQVIFSLLEKEHGIDFSHYKAGTVARRIDRRLQMSRSGGLSEYAEVLKSQPDEISLLYHDLLIGVTRFFRDPDSFELLRIELLPAIEAATEEDPLRIWCAGCASGEEAYSLAIMVYEIFDKLARPPHFKVFATDVHDRTLEVATRGVYPNKTLEDLTPKQRDHFFTADGEGRSRALPRLRHHLVFATQNVVSDPPFTKMDFVICRNLLIYLQDDAQAAAISGFRFALKENGLLMLGPSETLGRLANGFDVIEKKWRLFRKRQQSKVGTKPAESFSNRGNHVSRSRTFQMVEAETRGSRSSEFPYQVLADYLPSALLLDASLNILHAFGSVGVYLQAGSGKIAGNLMDYFDESTRSALFAILVQAKSEIGNECSAFSIELTTATAERVADAHAKAFRGSSANSEVVLLRFEEPAADQNIASDRTEDNSGAGSNVGLRGESVGLRGELDRTRKTLGTSIQGLESANQDLQTANEEMIASNEELQATNEELQSVNEELQMVNVEHQRKVQELVEMTDDFNNLFNNTDVGLILLDDRLRIRKFTKSASDYFKLMQHDVGRQLTNFAVRIDLEDFFGKVRHVLKTGKRFKSRARDREGVLVSVDISPYRTNNEVNGVIISMMEVVFDPADQDSEPPTQSTAL